MQLCYVLLLSALVQMKCVTTGKSIISLVEKEVTLMITADLCATVWLYSTHALETMIVIVVSRLKNNNLVSLKCVRWRVVDIQ